MSKILINKYKKNKIHIQKNSIKKTANQMGWNGIGTQEDPYIFENKGQNSIDLSLTAVRTHIRLKNRQFTRLSLVRCQNIVIDNCKISQLHIEGSKNIIIKNNRLLQVKHFLSKGNTFENNAILRESYNRLIKNYYDKWMIALMLFITGFGIFFLFLSAMGFRSLNYIWNSIIYLSSGIFAISIAIYYFQTIIRLIKVPPNYFSNFNIVPFTDAKIHFAGLIDLRS